MKHPPIRWGLIGPGNIARAFCQDLQTFPDAQRTVVASRDPERGAAFAHAQGFARSVHRIEDLAEAEDVDIVYVATPHPFHFEPALRCLDAGKAVLLEKPATVNATQFETLKAKAEERGVFLMEGMWSRFFPVMAQVRRWLSEGVIGAPRMLRADFGFRCGWNPQSRLLNPALGGGALLDVGIYTLAFCTMVLGTQGIEVQGAASIGETGVDEQTAMILRYPRGELALLSCAVRTQSIHDARIFGEEGLIRLDAPFWKCSQAHLERPGQDAEHVNNPVEGTGFRYQIAHVHECLRADLSESPLMPLEETLTLQRIMDQVRAQTSG